jgi:spore coat protein I
MGMYDMNVPVSGDMDRLSCRIEDEYGVKIKSIQSLGGHKFAADTDRGRLLIGKVKDKETQRVFIHGIYDYVLSRGFKNCINIYPARCGKHYIPFEGCIYTVSDYMDARCRLSFRDKSEGAAKLLAHFYKCAEGYMPPAGGKCRSCWGKWLDKYRKKARQMKKYRDEARNKDVKSRFDSLFLKSCDLYIWIIEQSVSILKKKGFLNIVENSMKRRQICLNDFKPSNLCRMGDSMYIKSLEKCRYDIAETDIADFFKEVIKSGDTTAIQEPLRLIEAYQDENPLSPNSIDIIKALMIFPEEYEKVCSRYYSGKDKWTEETYISKLHSAIKAEEKKMDFVKALGGINI